MLNKKSATGRPSCNHVFFFGNGSKVTTSTSSSMTSSSTSATETTLTQSSTSVSSTLFMSFKQNQGTWKRLWAYRWCMICFEILYLYTAKTNATIWNYLHLFTWKRVELFGVLRIPTRTWQAIFRFTHISIQRRQARFKGQNFPPNEMPTTMWYDLGYQQYLALLLFFLLMAAHDHLVIHDSPTR